MESTTAIDPRRVQQIWEKTSALLAARRRFPESTYRVQMHAGFGFRAAAELSSYLAALGITHCYASPYLKARPGSTHGYDITDHSALNPEIGNEEDYNAWVQSVADHKLGQVLDIVPNHMGVATNDNAWWNDVLENGPASRFAGYFDISWHASPRAELQNKVLLPVLGEPYGEVLEAGQLSLVFENGAFAIAYYDRRFPLDPRTYSHVLAHRVEELEKVLGATAEPVLEYHSIITATRNLPDRAEIEPVKVAERAREKEIIKRRLIALAAESQPVREFIAENVVKFNGRAGEAWSFDLLDNLIEQQCFRLSYWRVALDELNYRRFFDVNDLAALSMEREEVFTAAHALVLRLVAEGKISGLRIDHPDGLYDPAQYLRRLQERFLLACALHVVDRDPELSKLNRPALEAALRESLGPDKPAEKPLYVVVEKILGVGEPLLEDWSVHGTTGYDFLNMINGLFVDTANEGAFSQLYHDFIGDETRFGEIVYRKKLLILQISLAGEMQMLTHQLDRLAQKSRMSRDYTFNTLRRALREVIACFPAYRSYIADDGIHPEDKRWIEIAVRRAMVRNTLISRRVFRFIKSMLLLESPPTYTDADRAEQRRFAGKFQQVTSPVMAKGLEDTAFYIYNRLVSLNEVGGDPSRFGMAPDAVHAYLKDRQAKWPRAMSPLSTHDTKRSADVRARLNVLSEMPDEWRDHLHLWSEYNATHKQQIEELTAPDSNEEYLIYQTLLGAWPLEGHRTEGARTFVERIQRYMEKAMREAKVHTSWINPNAEYDRAVADFITRILDERESPEFLEDFRAFQRRISHYGLFNSLAQTLLAIAAPGVPDTYQGTEIWDFSLVDPDNRRPVDYDRRREMLHEVQRLAAQSDLRQVAKELLASKEDGRIKLYLMSVALRCLREHPGLFSAGAYLPLSARGGKANHIIAFARHSGDEWAIAAVPRFFTRLTPDPRQLPLGKVWGDTQLLLNATPAMRWRNIFTGAEVSATDREGAASIAASELFADFPVAMLVSSAN